jgi:hypothetical protein
VLVVVHYRNVQFFLQSLFYFEAFRSFDVFQIEMKFTAYKCGFKIAEVPVIFVNRELGTSKMNGSIFGEAVLGVIQLKLGSWFRKYPQKKTV